MDTPRIPKLILFVGEDLCPYSVEFEGNEEALDYDSRRIQASEDGIRGFYIVIGHAVFCRKVEESGLLPPQADEFTSAMWEMNREKDIAKISSGNSIPWLHSIFNGKNPNLERLIRSQTIKKRKILVVSENLNIEIRYHECVGGMKERHLAKDELINFYYKFLPDECKKIKISLEVKCGRGNISGEVMIINNIGTNGTLSYLDQVGIEIFTNFPSKFLVFWINTRKDVQKLYPGLHKFVNGYRDSIECFDSGGRLIKIPAEGKKLPVGVRDEGTEVCLVLMNSGKFINEKEIESRITKFVEDEFFFISFQKVAQDFRSFKLAKRKRKFSPIAAEMGLGEQVNNAEWMRELSANLDGFAETVCYMLIPNRSRI